MMSYLLPRELRQGKHGLDWNALVDLLCDVGLKGQKPYAEADLVAHLGTWILLEHIHESISPGVSALISVDDTRDTDA